jgi:hypothetical protein
MTLWLKRMSQWIMLKPQIWLHRLLAAFFMKSILLATAPIGVMRLMLVIRVEYSPILALLVIREI